MNYRSMIFTRLNVKVLVWALACLLLPFYALTNENLVVVKYHQDNNEYTITGHKTPQGYIFNRGAEKKLQLATLDWPPYIGDKLCNKGWVFQLTVALFVSRDYQVNVRFLPWTRAVRTVEFGEADVLFPEYFIDAAAPSDNISEARRQDLLVLSEPFPGGIIGFVKRKGEQDNFNGKLSNLKGARIGVVRGYQNTPEFDAMMDNNDFNIIEALDDFQLVKLLVAKRVDYIIGDPKVLRFSIIYSSLPKHKKLQYLAAIEDVKPSLQYNPLYFALSNKTDNWQQTLTDINTALDEFKHSGDMTRLITQASDDCFNN